MSLDKSLAVKSLSFTSDCLAISIGQLKLPETLTNIYAYFQGTISQGQNTQGNSIIIHSTTRSSRITIGDFVKITSQNSTSEIFEAMYSPIEEVRASFRYANISVFDSEIYMPSLPISGSMLSFDGDITIFKQYDIHATGSASTESDIDSMTLEIDLELQDRDNKVKKNLTELLDKHLKTEINSVLGRRKNAELLLANAKGTYDNILTRFQNIEDQYISISQKLETANATVQNLSARVREADIAFKEAFEQQNDLESGVSSLDDTCTEQECEDLCEEGVRCSTCYTPSSMQATGLCQTIVSAVRRVTKYEVVTVRSWRYERRCRRRIRIGWFFIIPIITYGSHCPAVCVSYTKLTSRPYTKYETYTMTRSEPCVTGVLFNEDTPSQCCKEYPCAERVKDFACLLRNDNCQRMREQALENAEEKVQSTYQEYARAQANLTLALAELERAKTRYSSVAQEFNLVEDATQSALESLEIRQQSRDGVFDNTAIYNNLINASIKLGKNDYIIKVDRLHWHVSLTSNTPVIMPVFLTFQYINQSSEILLVINLQDPIEAVNRFISTEILEQVLGPNSRSSRRRRQATNENSSDSTNIYLSETCAELKNIQDFLEQLKYSLNKSGNNFYQNNDKLKNLLSNNSLQYNSTNSDSELARGLILSLAELQDEKMQAVNSLSSLLQQNSYAEWQKATEMIYRNGSQLNGIVCLSFADCLQTALDNLESILEDTPAKGESIREKLLLHRKPIMNIATNENYTFNDAEKSVAAFENILQDVDDVEYWCADPPIITKLPPLEVNISSGETLELNCVVSSTLPVKYYWKRNSMLLSSTSNKLSIHNIQLSESGKYQCTVVSDAGRVSSLITTVNVYYSPIFNQTLAQIIETYDGFDNGISLSCDAHSWPPPGWKWLYRSSMDEEWNELYGIDANVFTFDKTLLSDEGWYTCVAYNWLGKVSSRPTFLRVLPAKFATIKHLITIEFEFFSFNIEDNVLSDLEANITKQLLNLLPPTSTQVEKIQVLQSSLYNNNNTETIITSFYLSTPYIEYNSSLGTEDIIAFTASSLMKLEKTKSNLTSRAAQPSGIQLELDDAALNSVQFDIDPRFLFCPDGYQVHSSQMICGNIQTM